MLKKLCFLAVVASLGLFTIGCSNTPAGEPDVTDRKGEKMETPKDQEGGVGAAVE